MYKSITEVSKMLNIQAYTLRFWETQFRFLSPKRMSRNRLYSPDDIAMLKNIEYFLKDKGYTIKGVNAIIKEIGIQAFRDITPETCDSIANHTQQTNNNDTVPVKMSNAIQTAIDKLKNLQNDIQKY